jgi:O-methyltransferase
MNNVFITQYFDWNNPGPRWVRYANRILKLLGIHSRLVAPQSTGATTNIEQRINMYHLLAQVLAFDVPGDIVEIGVDRGSSAALLQTVLVHEAPQRQLHLYDLFPTGQQEELQRTFAHLHLPEPRLHVGWIEETLPIDLPAQVAFAHIDLGPGSSTDGLRSSLAAALKHLYPRLAPRGICLIADYCEPDVYSRQNFAFPNAIVSDRFWNVFPVVREACIQFLTDRPEQMCVLYSGEYSHGFFRKR